MKKLILSSLVATFVSLFTLHSYGQTELSFVSHNADGKVFHFPVNELNSKAVRHFNQEFRFVDNETWFKIRDGFTVKFMLNEVQYRVGYDRKGNWLNTVKIYHEPGMPRDIRQLVKSNYYDYAITLIEELTIRNLTTYVVHIDSGKEFKKLYLADGEMEIMEEYTK